MGAITINNLGKAYKQYENRWSRLAEWMIPSGRKRHALHWVIKNVNFSVKQGEAVGIIGINGAGKSTLLKMITGTTLPTEGSVVCTGRVAAMLELGMGFHPDFTGRQNVFMAGQLLGHTVDQIAQLMPNIEAFAEIGDYIDQPVRVYSSGMQVRLAFSVATAIRPDILIIDEALSVGDAYFQHKSFDRIKSFGLEGTTLLIVSHDKSAIQSICDRAILLNGGRVEMEGEPEAVFDYYNALIAGGHNEIVRRELPGSDTIQTISGNRNAVVEEIELLDEHSKRVELINVGQRVTLRFIVKVQADLPELVLGYMIKDRLGQAVFGTNTYYLNKKLERLSRGARLEYSFTFFANLGAGTYSVASALHSAENHLVNNYEWRDLALIFQVVNFDKEQFVGSAWLPPILEYTHRPNMKCD
ncbi:ABC transporter ATP-binding protein [Paracandidimonas lactea]|uniref:ABC transporter ATP-binding protein n=1 Tax=Paracandidimonas lactea TaxID=2895524 RepID=UPI001F17CD97|nr:ABC transporter ATP-binding protein [Paracandidimonas lactea]